MPYVKTTSKTAWTVPRAGGWAGSRDKQVCTLWVVDLRYLKAGGRGTPAKAAQEQARAKSEPQVREAIVRAKVDVHGWRGPTGAVFAIRDRVTVDAEPRRCAPNRMTRSRSPWKMQIPAFQLLTIAPATGEATHEDEARRARWWQWTPIRGPTLSSRPLMALSSSRSPGVGILGVGAVMYAMFYVGCLAPCRAGFVSQICV
ncbi:hypothetical protein G7Z17_g9157 [Cylindrodendrum hubeiense]|uniref:Uncharacterized protein n=1 Tax=Cylindrodendrum hubeiense TaxID=595255 RepID=A0A9P5LCI2_9HYPO|nr:hypothetical protein G7Z17_g9157 [Cylindrodendrum hubeiense]